MGALSKIRQAGFNVSLLGDGFEIIPASALTTTQREFLKAHRAEIISELRMETSMLSAADRQLILEYLAAIGETDLEIIDEFLTAAGKSVDNLAWALQHAEDILNAAQNRHVDDRHYCRECIYLIGGQCRKQRFSPVDNIPRRCLDFKAHGGPVLLPDTDAQPEPPVVKCGSCANFKSYYDHGGGGSCAAGVMPLGACHWSETPRECDQYQIMRPKNGE